MFKVAIYTINDIFDINILLKYRLCRFAQVSLSVVSFVRSRRPDTTPKSKHSTGPLSKGAARLDQHICVLHTGAKPALYSIWIQEQTLKHGGGYFPPPVCLCNTVKPVNTDLLYLLKLVGYHGKGLENSICRPGDGDYPFGAVPLWDVDTSTALKK